MYYDVCYVYPTLICPWIPALTQLFFLALMALYVFVYIYILSFNIPMLFHGIRWLVRRATAVSMPFHHRARLSVPALQLLCLSAAQPPMACTHLQHQDSPLMAQMPPTPPSQLQAAAPHPCSPPTLVGSQINDTGTNEQMGFSKPPHPLHLKLCPSDQTQ